ncbi:MAG: class I SAM-dependent methyltransferase [Acidobacteria bacterium]|nr:class I SAM-dependent methyltransferase [Acidobacteriota bacterium]
MASRIGSDEEITRLKQARDAADRAYNDALTRVDRALPPRPKLPGSPPAFDHQQLYAVNQAWRVAPRPDDFLGTGWKRRLRAWVWELIGPIVERQQHFNGVVVDHLNRTAPAAVEGQQAVAAVIEALGEYTAALETFQSRLVQYAQQITPFVDTKDYEVAGLSRAMMSALDGLSDEVRKRAEAAVAREQRYTRQVDELRTTVGQVQHGLLAVRRRLEGLASGDAAAARDDATAGEAAPAKSDLDQPAPPKSDLDAAVDAYAYVGFENLYRGSRDEIRSRLAEYLPLFEGASDVLDIGCGRGEFLDLLRERAIGARGVDVNAEMVEECRARALDASTGDALTHLAALEDESLGGLFAAQVVEHLQPDYLVRLLNVAGRKLRPGARIVLETINPRCWFAFFDGYIRDITHVRPLHPDTLTYLLGASGFQRTTVRYLTPYPDDGKLQHIRLPDSLRSDGEDRALAGAVATFNGNVDTLNDLLFTHLDYAAIGERA